MADTGLIPKWVKKETVEQWIASKEEMWLMLLKDTHTPNANQQYVADIAAKEITDSNGVYVAGGIPVPSLVALENGNDYYLDGPDVSIGPGANLNYRFGALYTKTGGSSNADYRIRAQIDFDPVTYLNQIVTNGTSVIRWNSLGIILVS
jgi:hypothetical protein